MSIRVIILSLFAPPMWGITWAWLFLARIARLTYEFGLRERAAHARGESRGGLERSKAPLADELIE
jgi:hypothetical protein